MAHKTEPRHLPKSSHKLEWDSCAPLLADKRVGVVFRSLAEFKGSYPQQLAATAGISPIEAVGEIKKLESCGFIEKDEKEIEELGEEWAFYALTSEGYRVVNDLKHLGKLE